MNLAEKTTNILICSRKLTSVLTAVLCLLPTMGYGHEGTSIPHSHPHGIETVAVSVFGMIALLVIGFLNRKHSGRNASKDNR